MKFQILHESPGRVRLRAVQPGMSMEQADLLEAWLLALPGVEQVTIHERVCGVIIVFHCERFSLYQCLAAFSYERAVEQVHILRNSSNRLAKMTLSCFYQRIVQFLAEALRHSTVS